MEPLYDFKDAKTITGEVYAIVHENRITHLFPVLLNGTQYLATNDLSTEINLLLFKNGKLRTERHFRNAYPNIAVTPSMLPPIADGVFGFGQVRAFAIFDLKKNIFKKFRICPSIEDDIRRVAIANAERRQFILEINAYDRNSNDYRDKTTYLSLYDLSGDKEKLLKEMVLGKTTVWINTLGKIFLYDFKINELKVLDTHLEPSHHPLADAIKKHIGKIKYYYFEPHPILPFAILYAGENGSVVLTWGAGRDDRPKSLITDDNLYSFSPDGKWVTFKREDFKADTTKTYLMPVSEKYPNFLGTPILLWNEDFADYSCGWTTNPISFVGARLDNIYRWELTKEAQKAIMGKEADNYSTFHDYIVAKDLEKLTKEKKQGLGKK